jgi:uncharacterized protein
MMPSPSDTAAPDMAETAAAPGLREPRERLDPRARMVWALNELIGGAIMGVVALVILLGAWRAFGLHWGWVAGITGAIVLRAVVWAWVGPALQYRQWRYEIRDDEVDLLHGLVVRTRQIVPMSRIQHVDTTRGPLQRRFGLASVVFYTAAGAMSIPALSAARAAEVRDQIAALAKVHDDL